MATGKVFGIAFVALIIGVFIGLGLSSTLLVDQSAGANAPAVAKAPAAVAAKPAPVISTSIPRSAALDA